LYSPGGRPAPLKSGVGIPDISQKVEPRTGYQINRRAGSTGKKIDRTLHLKFVNGRSKLFLNIVAAHIQGLRHPPMCLLEKHFSWQCPFNVLLF
jgi:hypothetical protein